MSMMKDILKAEDRSEAEAWKVLDAAGAQTIALAAGDNPIPIDMPHQFAVKFLHEQTRAAIGKGEFAAGPILTYGSLRHAFHEAMTAAIQAYEPGKRYFD